MVDYSLFNAMDGSLNLSSAAFDESLTLNVLFQDRILVYDGSFFTCKNLAHHLERHPGGLSLFEVASRQGLIAPAMRDFAILKP